MTGLQITLIASRLQKYGPGVVLLTIGTVSASTWCFGNSAFLTSAMNADMIMPVSLAWDLAHHSDAWRGYQLPRIPSIFPDLSGILILSIFISSSGILQIIYGTVQFLTLILCSGWLVSLTARRPIIPSTLLMFSIISFFLVVGLTTTVPFGIYNVLLPVVHSGPWIVSLFGVIILLKLIDKITFTRIALLSAIFSLIFISDRMLFVTFALPVMLSVFIMYRMKRISSAIAGSLFCSAIGGCIMGYIALELLLLTGVQIGPPLLLEVGVFPRHIISAARDFPLVFKANPLYFLLLMVDVVLYAKVFLKIGTQGIDSRVMQVWLIAGLSCLGVTIFMVCYYKGIYCYRYMTSVWVWSIIFIASQIIGSAMLQQLLCPLCIFASLAFVVGFYLEDGGGLKILSWDTPAAACIQELRGPLQLQSGLADYWIARPVMLALNWDILLDQIDARGLPYYWENDRFWYTRSPQALAGTPSPNFIIMTNLDLNAVRLKYGSADKRVMCGDTEIWIYKKPWEIQQRLLTIAPWSLAGRPRGP